MQLRQKMQDLEKMAAKLWETARKLRPGVEQHALLEQNWDVPHQVKCGRREAKATAISRVGSL